MLISVRRARNLATLVNDISGQYGCLAGGGKAIAFGAETPAPHARQVYVRVKDVSLQR